MSASTSHTVYVKGRPITAKATADGAVSLRIGSLDGIGKGQPGSEHAAVVMTRDEADAISKAVRQARKDAEASSSCPEPERPKRNTSLTAFGGYVPPSLLDYVSRPRSWY